MSDVELHSVVKRDTHTVESFETEQHLVSSSTVGIGVEANVFVDELFSVLPVLEEPSPTFPIHSETKIGHVTNDLSLALFEWSEVSDSGPGDRSGMRINSKTQQ